MERVTTTVFTEEVEDVFEALGLRGGSATGDYDEDIMSQDDGPDFSSFEEDGADDTPASDAGESPTTNGVRSSGYQPGSIVRVTVDNFITYEHAEFRPGPNLNMIIGPNGTGKSSLVCAICLGLGYHSNVLGRATSFGEFVKHGRDYATVEVELQKRPHDPANFVVKLRIDREDNSRKFWINGRESKQKNLQKLTRTFHIQIDNLCQFLPQDKVAEFAGLNSVDLLAKTLQAAAPEQMIQWQNELKALFVSQKESLSQLQIVTEKLKSQESRQQNLQQDVQRLRDRQQVQQKVADLNDARVVVQYTLARRAVNDAREKKKATQLELRQLEEECGPVMQAVNRKQEYGNEVKAYLETRKAALEGAEQAADDAAEKVEAANRTVRDFQARHEVEKKKFSEKKQDLSKLRTRITNLEAQLKQKPREFDSAEWNTKIREQEHQQRDIQNELSDLIEEHKKVKELGQDKRTQAIALRDEIDGLDSQKGQLLSFLKRQHPDAAKGWQWIQENQGEFEKEVFGPPMLTCSVKDERYSELVQALLQRDDFLCFTTQSREDHKKLSHQFYKVMGLTVTIRTCLVTLDSFRAPLPANSLGSFGLDGYVLDFLEGPEPVLAMLCNEKKLHASGVALKDVTEEQYDSLVAGAAINSWAAGRQLYRVMRRREYGPGAVSTTTRTVPKGQFWTDQPVDAAERVELQRKLDAMEEEVQHYVAQWQGGKTKINELREQDTAIEKKITELRTMKSELQKAYSMWVGLGPRLDEARKRVAERKQDIEDARRRMSAIEDEKNKATLETAHLTLGYKDAIAKIQLLHQELVDLRIRAIEASSELAQLQAKNQEVTKKLEDMQKLLRNLDQSIEPLKKFAHEVLNRVQEIFAIDDERKGHLTEMAKNYETVEQIEEDIEVERSKLELIHAANPNAIREFEERVRDIDRLTLLKAQRESGYEELTENIRRIRDKWEPELDALIGRINDAFSYNFEQISCAGEVGVHKDEDFDKWAIEIKVKFRENETLQRLDQHRQSGGERAVSTIFYLMSLQSMAQAPFRVVDEINQGMDPRNERMVHERMVEIACREHTSQYFLITPKLLSGLKYDERMRVLCIASGEHMPEETAERKLDFKAFVKIQKRLVGAARG